MLNAIIRLALTHRTLVLAACLVVLTYGGYLYTICPSTCSRTSTGRGW